MALPALLEPVVADPARACVLCDFDGTISAIVDDPAEAVAVDGALDALERLAARLGCVAIVSGRPAAWLAQRLAPIAHAPIELHGVYGLERWHEGAVLAVPEASEWRDVIDRIAADAARVAPSTVLIEPKGLSVGLHYREQPTDEAWVMQWATEQAAAHGVSLLTGRLAVELRPPVARDKGHAAAELLERHRPSAAMFLGDDVGDVPVAVALRTYADAHDADAVVVCVDSEEAPPAMRSAADLLVDGPDAAVALLAALAAAVEA